MGIINSVISSSYYYPLLGVMLVLILLLVKYTPIILGKAGEYYAKGELKKLNKDEYKVINDVFIDSGEYTSQIDHIVVSKYGIFVIETKQYNGIIRGNQYDQKWVRRLKKKDIYYTNPFRQNAGHIKTLSNVLGLDEKVFHSIVYIPSTAILKIKHNGNLVRYGRLVKVIYKYKDIILPNCLDYYNLINEKNIFDKKTRKKYIKELNDRYKNEQVYKCPRCGNELKQKEGKYGAFYGCSNYPKCRYHISSKRVKK